MFTDQWLDKPNTNFLKIKSVIHIGLIAIIFLLGPQNTFSVNELYDEEFDMTREERGLRSISLLRIKYSGPLGMSIRHANYFAPQQNILSSLSLSNTHTHTLSLFLWRRLTYVSSLTHFLLILHTHTQCPFLNKTPTFSDFLSLSLSHTHTLSLLHTHTLSLLHTHTLSLLH